MKFMTGDYWCVNSKSFMTAPIIAMEKRMSLDHAAEYNHAGILVKPPADPEKDWGTTYEALRTIGHFHLRQYEGCKIIIARHTGMTPEKFQKGYKEVLRWNNYAYPAWRLLLYSIGLAKYLHGIGIPICSELVAEHCFHSDLSVADGYGWTPDALADKFKQYRCYDVVFEGELTKENLFFL